MFEKWKISSRQFEILVIMCFVGSSILLTPGGLATEAKQDAWIAVLIGTGISMGLVAFYISMGKLFPNMTFLEYIEKALGKWLGKAVAILFILFFFLNCALLLYVVGDFVTTQIMPETPIQFICILLVIVIVIGTRLGLETFARAAEVLYFWFVLFFVILILFLFPDVDMKKMQPVLETGAMGILRGTLLYISYSSLTYIVLMMIFPVGVKDQEKAKKSFYKGTIIGNLIIFLITLFSILVLGYDLTARNVFPTYALAKKISIAQSVERLEAVLATLWIITIYYKITLYFYGTVVGLAQIMGLKEYRPLTLPLGMILVVLSLIIYPNSVYASTWNSTTWVSLILSFGFLFPLGIFVIGKLRK